MSTPLPQTCAKRPRPDSRNSQVPRLADVSLSMRPTAAPFHVKLTAPGHAKAEHHQDVMPGRARLRGQALRPLRGHGRDDPLQVFQGSELNHDLALALSLFDLDPGLQHI